MEFIEASNGIYKPIRVLFDTPIYERAKQICWHVQSYKTKVAFMVELLHLQQRNKLPSELTAEAMIDLLVEDSKSTTRIQLWEFEMEDFDNDVKPLLHLVWEVNTSMLKRDVEFEARRLLDSPASIPASFKHPKVVRKAWEYAGTLVEQHQRAPGPKQLGPQDVVLNVVPKVLQGFWRPKGPIPREMPSQKLSEMAVGVTKAVLDRVSTTLSSTLRKVTFSQSVRDQMVIQIDKKVRQMYTADTLRRKLNSFEAEVLKILTWFTANSICELFEPRTQTVIPAAHPRTLIAVKEPDVNQATQIPAPAVTLPAEPPVKVSVLEGEVMEEEPSDKPDSAVLRTPSPPAILPAVAVDLASDLEDEVKEEPSKEQDSALELTPSPLAILPAVAVDLASDLEDEVKEEPSKEQDSALELTPSPPAILPAVAVDLASVLEDKVMEEQSTKEQEPDMLDHPTAVDTDEDPAVVPSPLPPYILPVEPPNMVSVLEDEVCDVKTSEGPASVQPPVIHEEKPPAISQVPEEPSPVSPVGMTSSPPATLPAVATATASVLEGEVKDKVKVPKTRVQRFLRRLRKLLCCCTLPKDD
ncbi:fibrous sheath CABYR-binding protein-like isoform X2 [Notolabrus celidotus]|uniref:fibrous sheath CABYR-binding protein-like isoform X2 n=1 Tax=Notolabrus celidotus TaxID=1203425 RepID=UPI00148FEAB7|nr:fibrous sheath CABYR-binding protein-like isoform X2 [Notolabrus celidotus]